MKFGKSISVTAFKELNKAESIQVVKNPKNDKLFITANGETVAAVSTKYDTTQPKEFVEMINEEDGSIMWCLHNPSNDNVQETL